MISSNFVRQSLKMLAPALFLLLCCSISASAQSSSDAQEVKQGVAMVVFRDAPVKGSINSLGAQLNLNIVFDETIKNSEKITIELNDVSLEKALEIVLLAKKLQARIIEENKIIVFPDNEANRQRYGQYELWPAKSNGK